MDPCDLRLAKGDDAVADLVEPRTPLFEFALRQIVARYDLDTPAGRAAALDEAAPVVARIKNSGAQHEVAVQLAGMLGILDTQFVVKRIAQLARWARDRGGKGPAPDRGRPRRGAPHQQSGRRPARPARSRPQPPQPGLRHRARAAQARPPTPRAGLPGLRRVRRRRVHRPALRRRARGDHGGGRRRVRRPGPAGLPGPGPRGRPRRRRPRDGHRTRGRGDHAPPRRQGRRRGLRGRPAGHGPPPRGRAPHPRHHRPPHPPLHPRRPRRAGRRAERAVDPPAVRPEPARRTAPPRSSHPVIAGRSRWKQRASG
ncbi:DNA primase [Streptomyces tendae]